MKIVCTSIMGALGIGTCKAGLLNFFRIFKGRVMKQSLKFMGVLLVVGGLAACTTPRSPHEIAQTTVDYQCGPGGQDPLTVQYTFQGGEALSARVIYQNQVVVLSRSTASNADMVGNTFRSDN